jgi:hypothetical protein
VIEISCDPIGNICFSPLFDHKWHLVELEKDFRLFGGPKELRRAKALLAREPNFQLNAEKLLLDISEIEIMRSELRSFAEGSDVHHYPVILSEVTSLEMQLLRRKQLIYRQYYQSVERTNWQDAANHVDDIETLQRKLESYQLLAPPELNAMVEQMFADEIG